MKTEAVETGINRSVWINCLVSKFPFPARKAAMDTITRGDKLFSADLVHFEAVPTS
jgi:hypothetical protein